MFISRRPDGSQVIFPYMVEFMPGHELGYIQEMYDRLHGEDHWGEEGEDWYYMGLRSANGRLITCRFHFVDGGKATYFKLCCP